VGVEGGVGWLGLGGGGMGWQEEEAGGGRQGEKSRVGCPETRTVQSIPSLPM
jgi:hypothetical protein